MTADFLRRPLKTVSIVLLVVFGLLAYDATSSYVSNLVVPKGHIVVDVESRAQSPMQGASDLVLTPIEIVEESEKYSIHVVYPAFNIKSLDEYLRSEFQRRISEFKYESRNQDSRAGYDVSYDTPYIDANIVSLKFFTCNYLLLEFGSSRCAHGAIGVNFDRIGNRVLELSDALNLIGMDLEELSAETRKNS